MKYVLSFNQFFCPIETFNRLLFYFLLNTLDYRFDRLKWPIIDYNYWEITFTFAYIRLSTVEFTGPAGFH